MSLNNKIFHGVFWTSIQTIIEQSISFFVKLLLARLLFPEDFGLVGMAVVFTSFVSVFNDIGIGAALVQRKKEDLRNEHFHTSFWTGIFWSTILYVFISIIVAPLAARFYSEQILAEIIPILSIGILASPINLVHKAQLTKDLNFKTIALIGNSCNIFSGVVAISLALLGYGVWSLVFNSVASVLVAIPFFFKATGWKPRFIWDKQAFKDIFGFGMYITGSSVFNNFISKVDYLLIGKFVSASSLGAYTFAFTLTDIVRAQIMGVMNKVMYPVYGQKQNNLASIKNFYLKVVRYNSLLVYPIMVIIFLNGMDIVNYYFGDKWAEAIQPMRILSVSVMFHMLVNSNTSLIRGLGKPKLEFQLQLFKSVVLYIPLVSIGIYYHGIVGAASAILINKFLSVIIAQHYLKKLISVNYYDLFKSVKEPLIGTFATITLHYFIIDNFDWNFIVEILSILVIFSTVYWLTVKKELILLYALFTKSLKS
jgi:teichuronic acid exporter